MDDKEIVQQIEPVRRTFLNVLLDNLNAANRINYVHRLIFVGEHAFTDDRGSIASFMEETIVRVNDEYHDEFLSGIFVYYPKYFCQIVEGSEDSIIKHLLLLTGDQKRSAYLIRMKVLVCYHHINQRFLPVWMAVTGKPPTLLERIDINTDLTRTSRHIYNCIQKLYKLADFQKTKLSTQAETLSANESKISEGGSVSIESRSTLAEKPRHTSRLIDTYPDGLPEYGLIEFLLATPYTQDLHDYISLYGVIPQLDAYKDKIWPIPTEFVPFHIFDTPIDPITDLPTAAVNQDDAFKDIIE